MVVVTNPSSHKFNTTDSYVHGSLESELLNILDYNPGKIAGSQGLKFSENQTKI